MNKDHRYKLAVFTLLSTLAPLLMLAPALSQAAEPRVFLEKSNSFALDDQVRAFRVPTQDSAGVTRFYDVTIELMVNTNGTLNPIANVTSALSPNITTGVIAPGRYKDDSRALICTGTNMTLTNGRIQSFFTCTEGSFNFQFSVATGPVAAGHPYNAELVASKINTRPDVGTQTWGVVTSGSFFVGAASSCFGNGSFTANTPIGAKTNGNKLVLSVYTRAQPTSTFVCGGSLTKLP